MMMGQPGMPMQGGPMQGMPQQQPMMMVNGQPMMAMQPQNMYPGAAPMYGYGMPMGQTQGQTMMAQPGV